MTSLFIALAIAAQAQPATTPTAPVVASPAGRALKDVPGVTITYHDLSEKDVKAINKALSKNKPLTPEQQALLGASTGWVVNPKVMKRTTGTVCTITSAQVNFSAKVDLPRFNEAWIPAKDIPAWRTYLNMMESQTAAKLWYPYDRLTGFEQMMVGKPCDPAMTEATALLDKVKADAAAYQPPAAPVTTAAAAPAPAN